MATTITIEKDASLVTKTAAFTAQLRGVTPLLMHKYSPQAQLDRALKKTATKDIPTPEEEAEKGAYRDTDGILYIPSRWAMRSMVESGKAFKNPGNSRQSLKNIIASTILPPPVLGWPLFNPSTGEPLREYTVDIQRVVVQRAAVPRARPCLEEWQAFITLPFDLGSIQGGDSREHLQEAGKTLLQVLTYAGQKQGFGDFRPEKGGSNGKFEVVEFSVTDEATL